MVLFAIPVCSVWGKWTNDLTEVSLGLCSKWNNVKRTSLLKAPKGCWLSLTALFFLTFFFSLCIPLRYLYFIFWAFDIRKDDTWFFFYLFFYDYWILIFHRHWMKRVNKLMRISSCPRNGSLTLLWFCHGSVIDSRGFTNQINDQCDIKGHIYRQCSTQKTNG